MSKEEPVGSEYICPICLEILIEPVTMPCKHSLCLSCYTPTVEKSNLTCPVCRMRISIWARKAAKNKTLVDVKKWATIQVAFPQRVKQRQEGNEAVDSEDDDIDAQLRKLKELSEPGAIRQEYEAALEKLHQQREEEAKKEEEASRALIEALQQEELKAMQELEDIQRIDRQTALEIEKELQSQTQKSKEMKDKSDYKKSKMKQCKAPSSLSITLNRFYSSVPRQTSSPLSAFDYAESSGDLSQNISFYPTPGLADFCLTPLDENHGGKMLPNIREDKKKFTTGVSSAIHSDSRNLQAQTHYFDNLITSDQLTSANFQPIVLCEKSKNIENLMVAKKSNQVLSVCDSQLLVHPCNMKPDCENVSSMAVLQKVSHLPSSTVNNKMQLKSHLLSETCCAKKKFETSLRHIENESSHVSDKKNDFSETLITDTCNPHQALDNNNSMEHMKFVTVGSQSAIYSDMTDEGVPMNDSSVYDIDTSHNGSPDNFIEAANVIQAMNIQSCDLSQHKQCLNTVSDSSGPKGKETNSLSNAPSADGCNSTVPCDKPVMKAYSKIKTLDNYFQSVQREKGTLPSQSSRKRPHPATDTADDALTQEEEDRRMAEELQKMFNKLDQKNIVVDRFKGSLGEYSMRKRQKK